MWEVNFNIVCLIVGLGIYIHQSFFEKKTTSNTKATVAGMIAAYGLASLLMQYITFTKVTLLLI